MPIKKVQQEKRCFYTEAVGEEKQSAYVRWMLERLRGKNSTHLASTRPDICFWYSIIASLLTDEEISLRVISSKTFSQETKKSILEASPFCQVFAQSCDHFQEVSLFDYIVSGATIAMFQQQQHFAQ
jgi:hypothetical protein